MATFETNVAGITFRKQNFENVLANHKAKEFFTCNLEREPDNKYDANAIKVVVDDVFIGYIPSAQAQLIAPMMDAGQDIKANVVELGHFEKRQNNGKMKTLPYGRIEVEV